jgi:phosphoglycerate dehydrogenase-like enzyme
MFRVAVLDDYQNVALKMGDWSVLDGKAEVMVFSDHIDDENRLVDRLHGFDCIVAMRERTPFTRELLSRLPNLKFLVTTGGANAAIDVKAAAERGIPVSATRSVPHPTSELTWGLILSLVRRIPQESAALKAGRWQVGLGGRLRGDVLGVLGLGRLGAAVARVGKAFGMEVIAWSQNLSAERAAEHGAFLVSKEELLERSDVLTIHLALSERTRGLIGAAELARMKPTAYLVNTARGPIVDETALVDTLKRRAIAGAAVDVFEREPLPLDHPFRELDNILLTPHIGYVTEETYRIYFPDVIENIQSYPEGAPIRLLNTPS